MIIQTKPLMPLKKSCTHNAHKHHTRQHTKSTASSGLGTAWQKPAACTADGIANSGSCGINALLMALPKAPVCSSVPQVWWEVK
jgi:hypothetical protein